MSDSADQADAQILAVVERARNALYLQQQFLLDGRCRFCEEKTESGNPFCNADCRDDFEKIQRRQRRDGRIG